MKNIKLLRVTNDYTQLKVQMETGISQSMLSKYESGDLIPTTENLMILADFYNTSLDYLMDRTAKKEKYPHTYSANLSQTQGNIPCSRAQCAQKRILRFQTIVYGRTQPR